MGRGNVTQLLQQRKQAEHTAAQEGSRIDAAYQCLFHPAASPSEAAPEIRMVPLDMLRPFFTARIGFRPYSPADLERFAQAIARDGLIEAIQVRPIPGTDEYEILAGHNRAQAHRLLGRTAIRAEVSRVDDARAVVIATVTNLDRRQSLCPSERGWAYRALLEAQKHQGCRGSRDTPSVEFQQKGETTRDEVARFFHVKPHEVQRDIRLTYLIDPLLEVVDQKELRVSSGVVLSYYDQPSQQIFYDCWTARSRDCPPKLLNAIRRRCPPPVWTKDDLTRAWTQARQDMAQSPQRPLSLSFDRAQVAPYLERVGGEDQLQALFLAFLQSLND